MDNEKQMKEQISDKGVPKISISMCFSNNEKFGKSKFEQEIIVDLKTVKYDYDEIKIKDSKEQEKFKNEIIDKNVIYLFYENSNCLYIGETGTCLKDRCYTHTPKECEKSWFSEGNVIYFIILGDDIDIIARQTIEAIFILAYRPKYNKKG